MEENNKPSLEEWQALFEAAVAFKRTAPWKWMYNDDIFGVKNPETGEIAYCCVMGNAGEHFAVGGYLGPEGLNNILGMLSGEIDPDKDGPFFQKCLMASFEDRAELAKEDLHLIKELGLKFRGRNEWPLFRSFEPGKLPWFLNAEQCRFLTHILNQSLEVSLRCQKDKGILDHADPMTFLTRVLQTSTDGRAEWVDQSITAERFEPQYISFPFQNEIRLRKLKTIQAHPRFIIEAATFYLPAPVKEKDGDRPYFPKMYLLVDHQEGMVISGEMLQDLETEGYKAAENLIRLIEQNNLKPVKLLVDREETYYLFHDVCDQIGVKVEKVDFLPMANVFFEEMFKRF